MRFPTDMKLLSLIHIWQISKANDNSFIKISELSTDDLNRLTGYDMVFINAMGLRITEEQRAQIQKAADGGLPVLTLSLIHISYMGRYAIISFLSLSFYSCIGGAYPPVPIFYHRGKSVRSFITLFSFEMCIRDRLYSIHNLNAYPI